MHNENKSDDPGVKQLQVFKIGDGNAMSGIFIAALRGQGETAGVAFLLD